MNRVLRVHWSSGTFGIVKLGILGLDRHCEFSALGLGFRQGLRFRVYMLRLRRVQGLLRALGCCRCRDLQPFYVAVWKNRQQDKRIRGNIDRLGPGRSTKSHADALWHTQNLYTACIHKATHVQNYGTLLKLL